MFLDPKYFKDTVKINARLSNKEDLTIILKHLVALKGSDLYLTGDDYAWIKYDSKLIRATSRILSTKEVSDLLVAFNGINSITQLGMADEIDTDLEVREPTEDEGVEIRHRFRVNAVNTKINGRLSPDITIRSISSQPAKSSELKIEQTIIDTVLNSSQGMFLMVGATGSGKSTTVSALIRDILEHKDSNKKVISIEKPIEFVFDDVFKPSSIYRPFEVGQCVKSFSSGVYNALRQAADVIYVGEIRDSEAILKSIEASNTGHFVISTLHSNTAADTIPRLLSALDENLQPAALLSLVHGLKGICAQVLVPTVSGRNTALREWILFTPEMKEVMIKSVDLTSDVNDLVIKHGNSMYKSALLKFEEGVISESTLKFIELNYGRGGC